MSLIRSTYPRVRSYRRNGHTYYDVDCRREGWTGRPRISFSNKAQALAKARQIGKLFPPSTPWKLHEPVPVNSPEMQSWERRLAEHGKTLKEAVVRFIHHLSSETPGSCFGRDSQQAQHGLRQQESCCLMVNGGANANFQGRS
jgi:hypothetical protein